jgi:hypothetical protein
MRAWVPSGSRARRASSPFDRALSGRATHLRVALPLVKPGGFRKFGIKLDKVSGKSETVAREHKLRRFVFGSTIATERHRSRTCLASGYDAVLVLKVCRVKDSWLLRRRFVAASVH